MSVHKTEHMEMLEQLLKAEYEEGDSVILLSLFIICIITRLGNVMDILAIYLVMTKKRLF
jgi:hypothetical protein